MSQVTIETARTVDREVEPNERVLIRRMTRDFGHVFQKYIQA